MQTTLRRCLILVILCGLVPGRYAEGAEPASPPVAARIDTNLGTASGMIRQFAFDGAADTFFTSQQHPHAGDHFTLVFDSPVIARSIEVVTGRPDGGQRLEAGRLDVSDDEKTFVPLAKFVDGTARVETDGRKIVAIRIVPTADMEHALTIRECTIRSEPSVTVFKYPVEFLVNVDDAPELKAWAENAARVCERAYPMINEELKSDGFQPPHLVTLTLSRKYRGVAMASGTAITGSVDYFKGHPKDVGAMVHETAHVVQRYRRRGNPGWLVEGVADYVRFFKFEPANLGRIDPRRAHYNSGYRVSAAFLAYLTDTYDKQLVRKLNTLMREGRYHDEAFQELTGKSLQVLDDEWRATLRP
jgi:hypothetical protein